MKKTFLNSLLVIVAIFSFSFSAIAETNFTSDTSTSIEIANAEINVAPAAPAIVATTGVSPGDFDYLNALSGAKSLITDNTEAIQILNDQLSNAQNKPAFDYINPPNSYRTNFDKTVPARPDKRLLKLVVALLERRFVSRT